MDMVRGRLVDGEVQPREDEGDGDGGVHGGGGAHGHGPWPLLLPWRWCCCGDLSPPQDGCQGGGIFVVPFDLGFLSLYRLSDSHHPDYVFSILVLEGACERRLGR